jgi:hypothetical protein
MKSEQTLSIVGKRNLFSGFQQMKVSRTTATATAVSAHSFVHFDYSLHGTTPTIRKIIV